MGKDSGNPIIGSNNFNDKIPLTKVGMAPPQNPMEPFPKETLDIRMNNGPIVKPAGSTDLYLTTEGYSAKGLSAGVNALENTGIIYAPLHSTVRITFDAKDSIVNSYGVPEVSLTRIKPLTGPTSLDIIEYIIKAEPMIKLGTAQNPNTYYYDYVADIEGAISIIINVGYFLTKTYQLVVTPTGTVPVDPNEVLLNKVDQISDMQSVIFNKTAYLYTTFINAGLGAQDVSAHYDRATELYLQAITLYNAAVEITYNGAVSVLPYSVDVNTLDKSFNVIMSDDTSQISVEWSRKLFCLTNSELTLGLQNATRSLYNSLKIFNIQYKGIGGN